MDTSEAIRIKHVSGGKELEILAEPDLAKKLKVEGEDVDIKRLLFVQDVFSDADSGDRASKKELESVTGHTQVLDAARVIAQKGDMQLTTEQRSEIREQKRTKLVDLITRRAKNPRTGNPHPRKRIENALEETGIDIQHDSDIQTKFEEAVDLLRPKIPISLDQKEVAVRIPAEQSGAAYNRLQQSGGLQDEKWVDGDLRARIQMPAGELSNLLDELQDLTDGSTEVKDL